MRSTNRMAGVSMLLLAALFFTLGLGSTGALAKPLGQQAGQTVTIAAGQSTTLQVRGFCIDPGKAFPTGISTPDSLATDPVRAGLNYAVGKGYDQSNPAQVQEAVWFLQTGTWQSTSHQLADEIVNAAKDTANAPSTPTGTSLLDVLKGNNATATITFKAAIAQPNQAFYGDGTLTITNTGSQSIQVYLPFGAIFPPANSAEQRLVGYAVGVSQAGTATVAATGTAAATAAATGTEVATGTAAPTETTAATATTAATETPAATSTVAATATTAATETPAPTETTAATATMAPTETPMAMATETPQSSVLPKTGAGSGSFPGGLLLFGLSLLSLAAGVALLRRNPTTH